MYSRFPLVIFSDTNNKYVPCYVGLKKTVFGNQWDMGSVKNVHCIKSLVKA